MNIRRFTVAGLLLGLICTGNALAQNAAAAEPSAPAQPVHIGVVRLDKIFGELQEAKDIKSKLESDATALQQLAQSHNLELKQMQENRDHNLKPDSPQFEDATEQLLQKQSQYKSELDLKKIGLDRSHNRSTKALYDKVEATCATVAKNRGLDMVITQVKSEFPANTGDQNPEAVANLLQQFIQQRTLIYVAGNIDITSDVTTAMDAAYKAAPK